MKKQNKKQVLFSPQPYFDILPHKTNSQVAAGFPPSPCVFHHQQVLDAAPSHLACPCLCTIQATCSTCKTATTGGKSVDKGYGPVAKPWRKRLFLRNAANFPCDNKSTTPHSPTHTPNKIFPKRNKQRNRLHERHSSLDQRRKKKEKEKEQQKKKKKRGGGGGRAGIKSDPFEKDAAKPPWFVSTPKEKLQSTVMKILGRKGSVIYQAEVNQEECVRSSSETLGSSSLGDKLWTLFCISL